MKICVLGLDCAAPEVVFGDERLVNIRRLMDAGVYGRLESVIPPITVPAWMCMCTSQDPGSLGVYGFRNRIDHSYDKAWLRELGFDQSAGHMGPVSARREAVDHRRRSAELSSAQDQRHQHRLFPHAGHNQKRLHLSRQHSNRRSTNWSASIRLTLRISAPTAKTG